MAASRAFGWIKQQPDQRDKVYLAPPHVVKALPLSFDLSTPSPGVPFDPPYNQGSLGSCGPHSLAGNVSFDDIRNGPPATMPSRLFLYYAARQVMGTTTQDSGVDNRSMLKVLARFGYCDESLWPYDIARFTMKPPQAAYTQAASRIKGILYQSVPQNVAAMKACLFELGRPIIFGFTVYESLMAPQVEATGDIPMPGMSERVLGGHDVLLVGWDDSTRRFKLRNSWGDWGKAGYGSIPYEYVNPNLSADYWSVTSLDGGAPPPPEPPLPPVPVPGVITIDYAAKKITAPPGFVLA